MAELDYRKLSQAEIEAALITVPGWRAEDRLLRREFQFADYAHGVLFAVAVSHAAEGLNHHPDILIGYARVTIVTSTHDAGGITSYDFELARRVNALA